MNTLQFSDHLVPYEMFIKDLASQIVRFLKEDSNDPEFISQRKAFELFGRRNIERWRKMGLIEGCRKPGKLEYRTADLRFLQRCPQDYLKAAPKELKKVLRDIKESKLTRSQTNKAKHTATKKN